MKAERFENQLTNNARDFARQIWLAGLGAFARTQEEGSKFFDALVQEGQAVDSRMKKTTGEKTTEDQGGPVKESVEAMKEKVGEIRGKTTDAWNKLEEVFQTRVARALRRLGVPTKEDIQHLFEQVDQLTWNIQELTQAEAEINVRQAYSAEIAEPVARISEPVV